MKMIQGWVVHENKGAGRERFVAYLGTHILTAGSEITLKQKIERYNDGLAEGKLFRKSASQPAALA